MTGRQVWMPALAGAAIYAALMWATVSAPGPGDFGTMVYNHLFLAMTEGRLDVPARVVTAEGHYTAEGLAYVYHGMAPLITRALAWPFVDLGTVSLAAPTVWIFAVLGSAAYQVMALRILGRFGPGGRAGAALALLAGVAVWFASPGPMIASNPSLYHEPIAAAYAAGGLWLAMAAEVLVLGAPARRWLVPMAVAAGVMVHARPHLAVGLYAATVLVIVWRLRAEALWRRPAVPLAALGVLFAFGAALLAANAVRFGHPLRLSGGATTWGFNYWDIYDIETPRVALSQGLKGGTFVVERLLPNLMLYAVDMPRGILPVNLSDVHRAWLADVSYVGVETPRLGFVWMWLPWVVLICVGGRGAPRAWRQGGWIAMLAGAVGGILMLSFATLALRYRADLWPLAAALWAVALAAVAARLAADPARVPGATRLGAVLVLLAVGAQSLVLPYTIPVFDDVREWSGEECALRAQAKGFGAADVTRICAL